mmetsp:Transcript_18632/g.47108  ORF Transcript_18632/g.47108 Transcript_18632/m.47108 type:complete len:298 (+) Transcript_18632:105-998(+)
MGPPVCSFWREGRCTRGSSCRFRHSEAGGRASKPCVFWARGTCRNGAHCPFAHVGAVGRALLPSIHSQAEPQAIVIPGGGSNTALRSTERQHRRQPCTHRAFCSSCGHRHAFHQEWKGCTTRGCDCCRTFIDGTHSSDVDFIPTRDTYCSFCGHSLHSHGAHKGCVAEFRGRTCACVQWPSLYEHDSQTPEYKRVMASRRREAARIQELEALRREFEELRRAEERRRHRERLADQVAESRRLLEDEAARRRRREEEAEKQRRRCREEAEERAKAERLAAAGVGVATAAMAAVLCSIQ